MEHTSSPVGSPADILGFFSLHGAEPDPYDSEDQPYQKDLNVKTVELINLRDTQQHGLWGPIYAQYQFNSCVANAAAALLTFEWNKSHPLSRNVHDPDELPSRIFIWYNARHADTKADHSKLNNGCHNRLAMKTLEKIGVCRESFCRYPQNNSHDDMNNKTSAAFKENLTQCAQKPAQNAYDDAETHYRISRYERLDVNSQDPKKLDVKTRNDIDAMEEFGRQLKENVCQALSEGHPVLFDYYYYTGDLEFPESNGQLVMKSRPPARRHTRQTGTERGAHTVLAVGYNGEHLKCLTSLSDQKYVDGCFLMPWDRITDLEATEDFWVVKGFQEVQTASKLSKDTAQILWSQITLGCQSSLCYCDTSTE